MITRRGKLAHRVINVLSGFVLNLLCVVTKGVFVKSYLREFLEYFQQYRRMASHCGHNALNSLHGTSIRLDNKYIIRL